MSSSLFNTSTTNRSYYTILNIPFDDPSSIASGKLPVLSKQQLKNAYHKALLKYHPDKSDRSPHSSSLSPLSSQLGAGTAASVVYTIDDITNAYKVLSDPELRAAYDRELLLTSRRKDSKGSSFNGGYDHDDSGVPFHTGLEVVDLEDLEYCDSDGKDDVLNGGGNGTHGNETGSIKDSPYWYRSCRCGDEKGFVVTEDELEAEEQHGEILVGCRGCSLWIKVLFAVAEEEREETGTESAGDAIGGS